jgi:hypothetical protein
MIEHMHPRLRDLWTTTHSAWMPRGTLAIVRLLSIAAVVLIVGCAEEELRFTEVKRPNERITSAEWAAFVRIVNALPEPRLAPLADVALPLPQWQDARTLPVQELTFEERRALSEAWEASHVARRFARNRSLIRLLRRENMTVEQFAGLALAIGMAMRRAQLPEEFSFEELLQRGRGVVDGLQRDQRLFSSLPLEARHRVLDEAIWLHRIDRAQRLRDVPPENRALVLKQSEWLRQVMPAYFQRHPFDDVIDLLEERGVPFVELPESGRDDELEWTAAEAIIGRTVPQ